MKNFDYDAWLTRDLDKYWGDGLTCPECAEALDSENDCLVCGQHITTNQERKEEAADHYYQQQKDAKLDDWL